MNAWYMHFQILSRWIDEENIWKGNECDQFDQLVKFLQDISAINSLPLSA